MSCQTLNVIFTNLQELSVTASPKDIEIGLSTYQLRGIMGNRMLIRFVNEVVMVIWSRGK